MSTGTHTEHHFEVRYPNTETVDEFCDEGDAQEWAVLMQRQGYTVQIFKRAIEVTRVVGEWEQAGAARGPVRPVDRGDLVTQDNRIAVIRAVVNGYRSGEILDALIAFGRIRAILDSAPPAPRVFFPGDTVPAESAVMDGDGRVLWSSNDWTADANLLDIDVPSLEERQAIVDRATSERAIPEPTEGQNP